MNEKIDNKEIAMHKCGSVMLLYIFFLLFFEASPKWENVLDIKRIFINLVLYVSSSYMIYSLTAVSKIKSEGLRVVLTLIIAFLFDNIADFQPLDVPLIKNDAVIIAIVGSLSLFWIYSLIFVRITDRIEMIENEGKKQLFERVHLVVRFAIYWFASLATLICCLALLRYYYYTV